VQWLGLGVQGQVELGLGVQGVLGRLPDHSSLALLCSNHQHTSLYVLSVSGAQVCSGC